jgi:F-type H+-transporting ATPase subunit delta
MKITANQYAKSLYAATKEKSQKEINSVVANFVKILSKDRQVKLFSKIFKKFEEIWNKEKGIVEAEVITSRKLESHQIHQVESFIKKKYQAKEVVLHNIIDEKIKGGIIIKIGDEVLDGSVRGQLDRLRNNLTN